MAYSPTAVLFLTVFLVGFSSDTALMRPVPQRAVVADVGSSHIFADAFLTVAHARWQAMRTPAEKPPPPEHHVSWAQFKQIVLDDMIQTRLLYLAAEDAGVVLPFETVAAAYQKMSQYWNSKDFEAQKRQHSMDTLQMLSQLREAMLAQKYLAEYLAQHIKIDDATIQTWLDNHPDLTQQQERVQIRIVRLQNRAEGDALLAQIHAGLSFEDAIAAFAERRTTAAHSNRVQTFARNMLPQAIEKAVFGLKPGDISPVLECEYGVYLVKMLDKATTPAKAQQHGLAYDQIWQEQEPAVHEQQLQNLRRTYTVHIYKDVLAGL
jgi:hypothetical protein